MSAPRNKIFTAIGMMSGTSLDGIDAAIIRSDGENMVEFGEAVTIPYTDFLRHELREVIYRRGDRAKAARDMTSAHVEAIRTLLNHAELSPKDIDLIGFHGQTIDHRPDEGITIQMGDPSLIAELIGVDVIADFRRRDVAAGGQGAPLVPLYHAALVRSMRLPVVVLNVGGMANVTWVGRSESDDEPLIAHDILAFDTGPGNVLLNEWAMQHTGVPMDEDGKLAAQGSVDQAVVDRLMQDPFFHLRPPKSLDRNYFHLDSMRHLSPEDGAATLTAFTVASIAAARDYFPAPAQEWIVAGGGRHNPVMMEQLQARLPNLKSAEALHWNGDAIEAQAFAFLAIRSYLGMPLTLPTTTGTRHAVTGGALYRGSDGVRG